MDYKKEYEKLNFETTNKKEEPPPRPLPKINPPPPPPPSIYEKPELTSPPNTVPKQPEVTPKEEDIEDDVVTGSKPKGRVQRRRNR